MAHGQKRNFSYLRWYAKDYRADPLVMAMTDDQDLAYRRMIDCSWELGPLPTEPDRIAALIRYSPERFSEAWTYPLIECWKEGGRGLINLRLERERKFARNFLKKQRQNGAKGGRPPKPLESKDDTAGGVKTHGLSLGKPKKSPPSPSPSPSPDLNSSDLAELRVMSANKSPTTSSKRFWWDAEKKRIWGTDEARAALKAKWLERGLTAEEFQIQLVSCDRWLEDREPKRREGSNLANRVNNWLNRYLTDQDGKARS